MITETINLSGMTCKHCVKSIEEAMKQLQVEKYEVKIGSLSIEYSTDKVSKEQIINAVEEIGYEVINNK